MPDYMYLLESRLSPEQRAVLERIQELSRAQELNVYLTGGAVRDLISGQPIRDLDFTVEGNPVRMVRELEKGGARVISESEKTRHYEVTFAGDADGSISAARDDVYDKPGGKAEYRFGGIMEDLRRRDFSINAIAISLNAQSRGLLLDPTNGLADLERQEVRALSIHAFTNQPVRLLRILRYCARMSCKMESRTQEWFDLAMERGLNKNIEGGEAGNEIRALAREDFPVEGLKQWESNGLLEAIYPALQKRKPDYDSLNKLARVRNNYLSIGIRPRMHVATTNYILGRLKSREASAAMRQWEFRSAETDAIAKLIPEAQKVMKILKGRKMNTPKDAYAYISSVPPETLVFLEVEMPNPAVLSKIRSYIQKWRPLRMSLPLGELDVLGIPRGPKFDEIVEQLFQLQLRGRARDPESRAKILRQLAGIKDEPKKKEEKEKKKRKGAEAEPPSKPQEAKPSGRVSKGAPAPSHPAPQKQSAAAAAIGARAQAKHEKAADTTKDSSSSKSKSASHGKSSGNKSARPAKKARGK